MTARHLRLVHASPREIESGRTLFRTPTQLTLPLPDPSSVLFVHERAFAEKGAFYYLLESCKPLWVFDARVTPRFDIFFGTRSQAFKRFSTVGAEYVDVFGRLGITSYDIADANPALWCEFVAQLIRQEPTREGPYVFVFDHDGTISLATDIIPRCLKAATNSKLGMNVSIINSV